MCQMSIPKANNTNNCSCCGSEAISGRVPPLTKHQLMRGNREAMLRDDRVRVVLQQPPSMHPIEMFIVQVITQIHLSRDSEREISKVI